MSDVLASQKKKAAARAAQAQAQVQASANVSDFAKMCIRVGKIIKAWDHESADSLLCEEIDVGEESTRMIASGIKAHYAKEDLVGRMVLVVCNLKASKILGFESNGMVLAAMGEDKVELVGVPDGSEVGERVFIPGLSGEPVSSAQVKKKKIWSSVSKSLKADAEGSLVWEGEGGGTVQTKKGKCVVESLKDVPVK